MFISGACLPQAGMTQAQAAAMGIPVFYTFQVSSLFILLGIFMCLAAFVAKKHPWSRVFVVADGISFAGLPFCTTILNQQLNCGNPEIYEIIQLIMPKLDIALFLMFILGMYYSIQLIRSRFE